MMAEFTDGLYCSCNQLLRTVIATHGVKRYTHCRSIFRSIETNALTIILIWINHC